MISSCANILRTRCFCSRKANCTNNILVAFEHVHMKGKEKSGSDYLIDVKLDMSKAYDHME